jgi:hypothetical protein
MAENLDLEVSIEEMKALLDHQYESIGAVKSNANAILSAASLIIALMGTFQLVNVRVPPADTVSLSKEI